MGNSDFMSPMMLKFLGSLTYDVEWSGSMYRQQHLAIVQPEKEFGLIGRDILPQEGMNTVNVIKKLPAVDGYQPKVKRISGSQPMFSKARKIPLPQQDYGI